MRYRPHKGTRPEVVERARWFAVQAHPERTKSTPHRALSLRRYRQLLQMRAV